MDPALAALADCPEFSGFHEAMLLIGNDDELYREVIAIFLVDYASLNETLGNILAAGKAADAKRSAHTLKGLAGTIGAEPLKQKALALEQALQDGVVPSNWRELFDAVAGELNQVMAIANRLPKSGAIESGG